jgi:hypothetical protein
MAHANNVIPIFEKSLELIDLENRMKLAATAYLIAFENNAQDIGTPNVIAELFLKEIIQQTMKRLNNG